MEDNKEQLPKVVDPLLEKAKNTFLADYLPCSEYVAGVQFMSTTDIYNLFFEFYPNAEAYTSADIAMWLHQNGYNFVKMAKFKYEWMLKSVNE